MVPLLCLPIRRCLLHAQYRARGGIILLLAQTLHQPRNPIESGMFRLVDGPDYYFSTPQDAQLRLQVPLKTQYDRWFERFKLLYPAPPSQLREKIEKAHEALSEAWIDLGRNYQITPNQQ